MNKKVCLVFLGNLYLCPYLSKYTDNLGCEFDIIYWNRDGIEEKTTASHAYIFNRPYNPSDGQFEKLKGYLAFKNYAYKILKDNNYRGVILLQTMAGILLKGILQRKYHKRFILDIRDYTMEKNKLFYMVEKSVINSAAFTVISSEGYKEFLPPNDYVVVHNNQVIGLDEREKIKNKVRNSDKIAISFIGSVGHYTNQHKRLLLVFKNDNRFELQFIGTGAEELIPFCKENEIYNVKIHGRFQPESILDFYNEANIINNLYGNDSPALNYALSNKLYFAAQLAMPILVCKGTYMEKVSKEYGIGYTFDFDDPNAPDKLYEYYKSIDCKVFERNCNLFLDKVNSENKEFEEKVRQFTSEQ